MPDRIITTRNDCYRWIEADLKASKREEIGGAKVSHLKGKIHLLLNKIFLPDEARKYLIVLRKYEYILNSAGDGVIGKMRILLWQCKYMKIAAKRGIDAFPNTMGPGISIPHGKVVISSLAKVGANCMILSDVTIGITNGIYKAPKIGDRVFIGSGARIIGDISIADDVCIGANAVVTKSITEPGITVAGNPARKISDCGSEKQHGLMVMVDI